MGDTLVEVALRVRAQHGEVRSGTPPPSASGGRTSQESGCIASIRSPLSTAPGAPPGQPGGVVLGAMGEPVVASPEGLVVLDCSTGTLERRVPIEQDRPENRAKDIKVEGGGRVWVGTMAFDRRPRNGALYRVSGGRVTRVVDGLTIPDRRIRRAVRAALPRRHGPLRHRRVRPGRCDGCPQRSPAVPRSQPRPALAGRHDRQL